MSNPLGKFVAAPPVAALMGWLIPGLGYFLIGHRLRGAVVGITILLMFIFGLLLAGVRVIDVPGYDDRGQAVFVDPSGRKATRPGAGDRWVLRARPFAEVANKPWFVGQVLAGPVCLISASYSIEFARPTNARPDGVPRSHARIYEIGTLYTAVAGMLNLLAIIDVAWRAGRVSR